LGAVIRFPVERTINYLGVASGIVLGATPRPEYLSQLREATKMAKGLRGVVTSDKIPLKVWDPSGETYVRFQRPSRFEAEQLDTIRARAEIVWSTAEQGTVRQRDMTPLSVQESEMVAMCLVESNLPDDNGDPVFVPGKTCRQSGVPLTERARGGFFGKWHGSDFPDELAQEIIEALVEWHPDFDLRSDRGE
jgi:hypothetical protein